MPNANSDRSVLGTGPIGSLVVQFALPSIVAMLVSSLYNIVDQYFIGQSVGELGNAATNISFPLTLLCTAFALMFGIGGAANFNITMGKAQIDPAEKEKAPHYMGKSMFMLVLLGIVLCVITLLFLRPLLVFFGSPQDVLPLSETYTGIVAYGFPFVIFATGAANLIRADGRPKSAMMCNIVGAGVNTVLDAWFVFGLGWGMAGAAWATVIGQVCSGSTAAFMLHRAQSVRIRPEHIFTKTGPYVRQITALGLAPTFNQLAMMVVMIFLNNSFRHYGAQSVYGESVPIAVSGIISKVNMIFMSFVIGLSQGMQPIVSFNYGAQNYGRARQAYLRTCLIGFVIACIFWALFQLFPRQIISIFGPGSGEYYTFAIQYFRVFLFFTFLNFLQPISANLFTAIGVPKRGILLSLTRQIILLLPMILILPLFMGIEGILYAGPVADLGAAIITFLVVRHEFRRPEFAGPQEKTA